MLFGQRKNRHVSEMERICSFAPDQDGLNINDVRKILLYLSNGLAPYKVFADPQTGQLLNVSQVCANGLKSVKKNTNTKFSDIEEYVGTMMAAKPFVKAELPCILPKELRLEIEAMVQESQDDVARFRAKMLKQGVDLRGIHLFNFDGSPRCSSSEIRWAVCHFPVSTGKMKKTMKILAIVAVFSALVVIAMRTQDRDKLEDAVESAIQKAAQFLSMSRASAMKIINSIFEKIRNKTSGTSSNEIVRQIIEENSDGVDEGKNSMPLWKD